MLSIRNLQLQIHNNIICHHLSLQVNAGEVWGILGANGSGKTTLLHTIAGLKAMRHGEIYLHEIELRQLSMRNIAQKIAILFQEISETFPQTVWEYCSAARFPHRHYFAKNDNDDHAIIQNALRQMGLEKLASRKITQLSGGEKRRLALASVIAQTPTIFLLDEPSNHLDIRHQMQTLHYLRELVKKDGKASIMALHDVNLAQQFCDHILMLFGNGETLHGKTQDVLTQKNLHKLYGYEMTLSERWG